ncbi:MAG: TlpA family protein disulfide reductase [Planctomycetota bacterium]
MMTRNLHISLIAIAAALILLPAAAFAQSPNVGEDAPDFGSATWALNQPEQTKITELRGEVIVVEHWGVNCGPCLRLIPHMEHLYTEHEATGQGLHIFTFERQNHDVDTVRSTVISRGGGSYPVSAGGCENYRGTGGIPMAWVIGVDGKIVFAGNPGNAAFDAAIKAELAKVKYPGLGKLDVHKDLDKAARAFSTGDYAKAVSEAQDTLNNEKADDAAKADATFIAERAASMHKSHLAAARAAEDKKKYLEAIAEYEWIVTHFGSRSDEGTAAKDRVAELKKDKDVKAEIKAWQELDKLSQKLTSMQTAPLDRRMKEVEKFVEKYEGSAAAAAAKTELANLLK